MTTHALKTDPDTFDALRAGKKTFEIRLNDRGFEVGDVLVLRCTLHTGEEMQSGMPLVYTGELERRVVTHILRGPRFGLAKGWVIMSVENCK